MNGIMKASAIMLFLSISKLLRNIISASLKYHYHINLTLEKSILKKEA